MHLKDLDEICPIDPINYHSHTPVPGPLAPGCFLHLHDLIKINLFSSFLDTNGDVSSIFNKKTLCKLIFH